MDATIIIVIAVIVLIALAAGGVMLARRRRSDRLQDHFGSEYDRSVAETGDRKAAEAELTQRERRRRELDIRELRPEERSDFEKNWDGIQRSFVDDPPASLRDADILVVEIMRVRGYPVDEFDRRAEDISVDHPKVVQHYREARQVHDSSADGTVDTEQQRHAMTSYRSLVDALLGRQNRADHDSGRSDNNRDDAGRTNGVRDDRREPAAARTEQTTGTHDDRSAEHAGSAGSADIDDREDRTDIQATQERTR